MLSTDRQRFLVHLQSYQVSLRKNTTKDFQKGCKGLFRRKIAFENSLKLYCFLEDLLENTEIDKAKFYISSLVFKSTNRIHERMLENILEFPKRAGKNKDRYIMYLSLGKNTKEFSGKILYYYFWIHIDVHLSVISFILYLLKYLVNWKTQVPDTHNISKSLGNNATLFIINLLWENISCLSRRVKKSQKNYANSSTSENFKRFLDISKNYLNSLALQKSIEFISIFLSGKSKFVINTGNPS